jgi:uncharacterized membrane protein (DUF485 family)
MKQTKKQKQKKEKYESIMDEIYKLFLLIAFIMYVLAVSFFTLSTINYIDTFNIPKETAITFKILVLLISFIINFFILESFDNQEKDYEKKIKIRRDI